MLRFVSLCFGTVVRLLRARRSLLIENLALRQQLAAITRIIPKQTSFRSPWQNGIAERWVGSCRRDLLDHIVALNERHLKRLLSEYVRYHHEDRTHLGLEKGTPDGRIRSVASGRVLSRVRLGGLHHRYNRAA
jgi:putative transposase